MASIDCVVLRLRSTPPKTSVPSWISQSSLAIISTFSLVVLSSPLKSLIVLVSFCWRDCFFFEHAHSSSAGGRPIRVCFIALTVYLLLCACNTMGWPCMVCYITHLWYPYLHQLLGPAPESSIKLRKMCYTPWKPYQSVYYSFLLCVEVAGSNWWIIYNTWCKHGKKGWHFHFTFHLSGPQAVKSDISVSSTVDDAVTTPLWVVYNCSVILESFQLRK